MLTPTPGMCTMPGHNRMKEFKAAGSMTARAGGLQHNRAQTSAAQQAMGGRTGVLLQEEALGLTGAALAEAGPPCAAEGVASQAKAGAALAGREAGAPLVATGARTAAQMQACMAAGAGTAASSRPAGGVAWEADLAAARPPAADLMGLGAGAALPSVAGDFLAGGACLRRSAQSWGWARALP